MVVKFKKNNKINIINSKCVSYAQICEKVELILCYRTKRGRYRSKWYTLMEYGIK